MKKTILILLFAMTVYGQSSLLLLYDEGYKNAETKIYLASLTTPISKSYAKTLDRFITMVKDSLGITSLSSKFDVMYDLGGETAEQSLKNLVKRQHDATAVNSPTFTQWQGFQGNGTSSYLNTNYNPTLHGINFTQNNASFGFYRRSSNTANGQDDMGHRSGTSQTQLNVGQSFSGLRINSSSYISGSDYPVNQGAGLWIGTRVSSNYAEIIRNGITQNGAQACSTVGLSNSIFLISASNGATGTTVTPIYFSPAQYSFAFIGAGLTATEVAKLTNCIEWLMDAKGTGVIP